MAVTNVVAGFINEPFQFFRRRGVGFGSQEVEMLAELVPSNLTFFPARGLVGTGSPNTHFFVIPQATAEEGFEHLLRCGWQLAGFANGQVCINTPQTLYGVS